MKLPLTFSFLIPLEHAGKTHKELTLLKVNGLAEKIFAERLPEKPYSWMGGIISSGIAEIGGITIGSIARSSFSKNGVVTIPDIILNLPMAEANTLLIEIHRRIWKQELKNQECLCKYCGRKMIVDLDLAKIKLTEASEKILSEKEDFTFLTCDLPDGWLYESPFLPNGQPVYPDSHNQLFNRFVFRVPTLKDAIRHEQHATDSITFWRLIAFDCLVQVTNQETGAELQISAATSLGQKLYEEILVGEDLQAIREILRDSLPTLPMWYEETCPNTACRRLTPLVMEQSSFYSE